MRPANCKPCAELTGRYGAASFYSPASGVVVGVNPRLAANPALAHEDPEGAGWLFRLRPSTPDELGILLDENAYLRFLGGGD